MTADLMMKTTIVAMIAAIRIRPAGISGQRGAPPAQDPSLPEKPVAVSVSTMSPEVKGPGSMFDATPSLPPGKGLSQFGYEAKEYFVSGMANQTALQTRLVARKPTDNAKFSGLVLAEAMHPSGAAHMFEFTSRYTMSSGRPLKS